MALHFSAVVGWEVKLTKALLWSVSSWPKISCPQANFVRLDSLKGLSCPWQPSSQTSSRALSDLPAALSLLGSFPSHPQPHPDHGKYMVAMGTGIGCLS